MKKNEMKMTENTPTTMLATVEAREPSMLDTPDTLLASLSLPRRNSSRSNLLPTLGNALMIQALILSSMLRSKVMELFIAMASRMMPETIGMICVTMNTSSRMMDTSVKMEMSQSGADFPLMVMPFTALKTGCPSREMTNATMMYASTLLKYQHIAANMAKAPRLIRCRASLSMLLSSSMAVNVSYANIIKRESKISFIPYNFL